MKIKRVLAVLLTLMLAVTLLAGCGGDKNTADGEKEKVTVALWGNQLLENYAPYLCETFPDVEFEFILIPNSTDYYRYLDEHGELPDIMTVRRFSLGDAVVLKDSLYDLCDTDLASTFYGTYLENYTYDDGTINWLPACAEVDSIIINKTLFEENNIDIPTDYDSFIAACDAFEALGIRGFASDFSEDYTCMETLQGFSISTLLSMEGREWRTGYESGATEQLSEEVWLPVFEKMFDLKEKGVLEAGDVEMINNNPKDMFLAGELAMYRGTGQDVISYVGREGDESMLMPYFGDTEDDNWYLTYPSFQAAISKQAAKDPEREALLLDILSAMLGQDGLEKISYGKNMIPYNKDISLELLPELDNLKPYIDDNKIYIRLASNDMFRISKEVVQKILTGDIATPEEAYAQFNTMLAEEDPADEVAAHIDRDYTYVFSPESGSEAVSAIFNTIRVESGADLVFGQSCFVSGDIHEGDYTENEVGYLMSNDGGHQTVVDVTGDQLYSLVEYTLALKGSRGSICNDSTLYASSGFEMDITKNENGYILNALTIDGEELDRDAVYTLLIYGDQDWYVTEAMEAIGCTEYDTGHVKCKEHIHKRLVEDGGQLEEPTDYITLK